MTEKTIKRTALLRRPAVWVLLAAELLVLGLALAAALRPAADYTFTADQWESIAQTSEIGYDEDGRIGVTEMTDGEDILQTPAMSLPKGHYNVTVDYRYVPGRIESGREHHACVYFKANEPFVVTGEKETLNIDKNLDTVELNVRSASDTVQLVACNDGGIFTLGAVRVQQNRIYAWACVLGWLLCFGALDALGLLLAKTAGDAPAQKEKLACWVSLAAIVLLAAAPMLTNGGGLWGDDCVFHLSRIEGIAQALREGQFPVRVYSIAKNGYGYGSPLFYGEILLYFPAVLRLLGGSVQGAYHAYALLVLVLTAAVSFYALRQIFKSRKIALLGTALYMLAPYHLHNIYYRMAVGEYSAQAFLLLVPAALCLLYGEDAPDKNGARKAWAELVLAFGMLLQTHMLSLELTTLACAVFCLCRWRRTFTKRVLGTWAAAAGTVVLLNAWFLLPFVSQMLGGGYKVMQAPSQADAYDIQRGGLQLADFLAVGNKSLGLGLEFLVCAAAFLWCLYTAGDKLAPQLKRVGIWSLWIGAAACFASTSLFPWGQLKKLPVLGNLLLKTQFAWRFLALATPALLLAGGCALVCLRREKLGAVLAGALAVLSLTGTLQFYRSYLPGMNTDYVGSGGQVEYAYTFTNVGWLCDGMYLPDTLIEGMDGFENLEAVTTVEVQDLTQQNGVTALTCTETTGQDQHAELPLVYYPGYTVAEGPGQVFKTVNGLVGVTVPANYSGTIRVAYREPKRWLAADLISLATAIALAVLAVRRKKRGK